MNISDQNCALRFPLFGKRGGLLSVCRVMFLLSWCFCAAAEDVAFWSFDGGSDVDSVSGLLPLPHEGSEVLVFTNDYLQVNNQGKDYATGEALLVADDPVLTGHDNGGPGYTSLVLEVDIRLDETGNQMQILRKTEGTSDSGYQLFVNSEGLITFRIVTDLAAMHLNSKNSLSADGRWHHIEAVWDGSLNTYTAHLVVDGVVSMAAPALGSLPDTTGPLSVGGLYRTEGNTGQLFCGGIDNVRISIDRPELMSVSGLVYPYPAVDDVSLWSFDGGSDADSVSGLIPQPHEGSEVLVFTDDYLQLNNLGKDYATGEALLVDDDPVLTGHDNGGTGYTSLVVEVDIRLDETGSQMQILRKTEGTSDSGYQLFVRSDGAVSFLVKTDLTTLHLNSENSLSADGRWHHIEAVWDGGVDTCPAYLVVDGVVSWSDPVLGSLPDTTGPLSIGGLYRAEGNTGQLFCGGIDNVRIGIKHPYPVVEDVALWSFDDGSDEDSKSGLLPLPHEDSEVLVFTNDYLQLNNQGKDYATGEALLIPDSPLLTGHDEDGTGYTSLILEADILLDETGNQMQILRKTEGTSDLGYQLFVRTDGAITFRMMTDLELLHLNSANCLSADGSWHHIEVVWDGSMDTYSVLLVVDGVATGASSILGSLPDTTGPLSIGGLYRAEGNTGQLFCGGIDNVRIGFKRPEMTGTHLLGQPGMLSARFVFDEMVTPECHASTLTQCSDGSIVASWFGGTHEGHVDVGVWQSVFDGQDWSWPRETAHGFFEDGTPSTTFNPVLFQYPDDDVMLLFFLGGELTSAHGTMQVSDDDGMTWSEPSLLPASINGATKNKPILLDDGTLICPDQSGGRLKFVSTRDFGATWFRTTLSAASDVEGTQPTILQHADGTLQALARSTMGSILTSWSYDQGESWTALEETTLPNNNSGIDAVTLSDGRLLVVYNHATIPDGYWGGPRTPLNVAISEDGVNWSAAVVLEDEDGEFAYPSVIQAADGTVHVLYTWNRLRIKHVMLDPDSFDLEPIVDGEWPELTESTSGFLFAIK